MTMTAERLAELDAVMAKATDGPWSTRQVAHGAGGHEPIYLVKVSPAQDRTLGAMTGDDGEAIAAAMNAYPDLRAHIEAQAATIARIKVVLKWYADQMCEHSTCFEGCGKLTADACAGCPARAALTGAA